LSISHVERCEMYADRLANNSGTHHREPEMILGANLSTEGEADWICA
jgi:hypothetical protein